MQILHIAHRFPYPPNKGDKIRTFHILKHFARHHAVHLVTLVDDASDFDYVETLKSYLTGLDFSRIDSFSRKFWSLRHWPFGGSITTAHFHKGLVPSDDSAALAAAILRVCHSDKLGDTLGAAGRRRFEQPFSFDAMLNRYRSVYSELLCESRW